MYPCFSVKLSTSPEGLVKLEINNCQPNDSGAYKLIISNPHGEKVALCAVAVKRKALDLVTCIDCKPVPMTYS